MQLCSSNICRGLLPRSFPFLFTHMTLFMHLFLLVHPQEHLIHVFSSPSSSYICKAWSSSFLLLVQHTASVSLATLDAMTFLLYQAQQEIPVNKSPCSLLQILPCLCAHILGAIQFRHPLQPCLFLMTLCHDEMLGVSTGFMKFNNKLKEFSNLGWVSCFQRHSRSASHSGICIFCLIKEQTWQCFISIFTHARNQHVVYTQETSVPWVIFSFLWPPVMQVWAQIIVWKIYISM